MDSSQQSECLEAKDCTMSKNLSNNKCPRRQTKTKRNESATAECHLLGKKTIFNDKLNSCNPNFPNTKSSLTLPQESISKEKVCVPFWNSHAKECYQKLWLPTEIGSADSHLNSLNGYFTSTGSNSWFTMKVWKQSQITQNLLKTCLPSSTFSIAESMEDENTKMPKERKSNLRKTTKPIANCCRKIRLKPSNDVKKQLRQWFGSVRSTYNWALSCIKEKPKEYKKNVVWLRKRFINACNIPKDKKYLLDTPKHIRDTAIADLVEAFKSNKTKQKKDPSFKFNMNFRKKKDNQSITLLSEAIKKWDVEKEEVSLYPTFLRNKIKFHCRNVPLDISYDTKLQMDKLGRFYLCVPHHEVVADNQSNSKLDWCSLDPGVRDFMTLYSPTQGICYKFGSNDISRIFRLCKFLDKLLAKKRTRNIFKAQIRLRHRIKHLVDEVHWKTIHFLCNNFNNIILPPFQVSQMVKRQNRKIRNKTVRQMLCWRHYTFKMRLQSYVANRSDVNLFIRGEEYTSKTCSGCLNIKHNLGGAKIYKCTHCHIIADRDAMGARNIFIKNASLVMPMTLPR